MDDKLTLIADLVSIEKREALKHTTRSQPLSSARRQQELHELILRRGRSLEEQKPE